MDIESFLKVFNFFTYISTCIFPPQTMLPLASRKNSESTNHVCNSDCKSQMDSLAVFTLETAGVLISIRDG